VEDLQMKNKFKCGCDSHGTIYIMKSKGKKKFTLGWSELIKILNQTNLKETNQKLQTRGARMKCPKCKKDIDYLHGYSERRYGVSLSEADGEHLDYEHFNDIDIATSFECPECDKELFTTEGEALKFLKGEKE